tara:strand:- start:1464 stop:1940 length:477 start_codon:yes stop_codon:yes gene_type:complete
MSRFGRALRSAFRKVTGRNKQGGRKSKPGVKRYYKRDLEKKKGAVSEIAAKTAQAKKKRGKGGLFSAVASAVGGKRRPKKRKSLWGVAASAAKRKKRGAQKKRPTMGAIGAVYIDRKKGTTRALSPAQAKRRKVRNSIARKRRQGTLRNNKRPAGLAF